MNTILYHILLFSIFFSYFVSEGFSVPVDISFLVADVKYSEEKGAQICEIQHGTDSTFKGEVFSNGGVSTISENFVQFFSSYELPCWFISFGIADKNLKKTLYSCSWRHITNVKSLIKNKNFKRLSKLPVVDPYNIASYQGFVFAESHYIKWLDILGYSSSFILIDRAVLPVWKDKYETSLLFKGDSILEARKPRWNLYPKKYTKHLSKIIIDEFESDLLVIKPRNNFCGNGVIIVRKEDLDHTLKYIFIKSKKLKNDPDRAYHSWYDDNSDTFLVEEFVSSDPVHVQHLGMKPYCPTIRVAFLAIYDEGVSDIHFLGAYYCLPEKSLTDEGNLHQKYKASLQTIHSSAIEQEKYELLTSELYEPFRRFYLKIFDTSLNAETQKNSSI